MMFLSRTLNNIDAIGPLSGLAPSVFQPNSVYGSSLSWVSCRSSKGRGVLPSGVMCLGAMLLSENKTH